jgi:preprotein translocase subunit SecB
MSPSRPPTPPPSSPSSGTPAFNLNLNSEVNNLENDRYEVVLTGTVTAKAGDKNAYLVEVKQAGVFIIRGFPKEEMGPMLGAYCPNILFPFLREVVSDLVNKGSFPQLLLTPVNFEALYAQHLHNQRSQQQASRRSWRRPAPPPTRQPGWRIKQPASPSSAPAPGAPPWPCGWPATAWTSACGARPPRWRP